MGWQAIVAALIAALGPVLADFLKALLEKWLSKAAATLPAPESFATKEAAQSAVYDRAISMLPWYAFVKRAFFRRAKALSLRGVTPTADELAELHELAQAASENE